MKPAESAVIGPATKALSSWGFWVQKSLSLAFLHEPLRDSEKPEAGLLNCRQDTPFINMVDGQPIVCRTTIIS